jgi:hypothetical protein
MRVSAIFKELEGAGRNNTLDRIPELFKQLNEEYKILAPLLRKIAISA